MQRLIDFRDIGSDPGAWLYTRIIGHADGWNAVARLSVDVTAPAMTRVCGIPETIFNLPGGLVAGQMLFHCLEELRNSHPEGRSLVQGFWKACALLHEYEITPSVYLGYASPKPDETPEDYLRLAHIPPTVQRIYFDSLAAKGKDDFDFRLACYMREIGYDVVAEGVPTSDLWADWPVLIADDDPHLPRFDPSTHRAERIMLLHGGSPQQKLVTLRQARRQGWSVACDIQGLGAELVVANWESAR